MEGLTEKEVRSVFGHFYDSHNDRVEEFTVKHFYEMGEYNNIFYFKVEYYIVLFGIHTHHTKMLDITSAMQDDCHKLPKDTPVIWCPCVPW